MARHRVELTEEDLDNPAVAFLKMVEAMRAMPQDLADIMARQIPDYRNELKTVLTVLKAIEGKPALALQAGVLESHAHQGAKAGTSEAVAALRSAATAYRQAQHREMTHAEEIRGLSWKYLLTFAGLILLAGIVLGLVGGRALDNREEKPLPSINLNAETVAGLLAEKFPERCQAKPPSGKRP